MNRKYNERNNRKLIRIGNTSLGLTLPTEFVHELKWRERQAVKISRKGRQLIITKK